jgi:citronellyl-CoA dehydrogenase
MSTPALAKHGSHFLKRNFLQPTVMGELLPCLGVSEAGAGSDVAAIKTSAVKDGGDYVINGDISLFIISYLLFY